MVLVVLLELLEVLSLVLVLVVVLVVVVVVLVVVVVVVEVLELDVDHDVVVLPIVVSIFSSVLCLKLRTLPSSPMRGRLAEYPVTGKSSRR